MAPKALMHKAELSIFSAICFPRKGGSSGPHLHCLTGSLEITSELCLHLHTDQALLPRPRPSPTLLAASLALLSPDSPPRGCWTDAYLTTSFSGRAVCTMDPSALMASLSPWPLPSSPALALASVSPAGHTPACTHSNMLCSLLPLGLCPCCS